MKRRADGTSTAANGVAGEANPMIAHANPVVAKMTTASLAGAVLSAALVFFGPSAGMAGPRNPTYRRDVFPILQKNCLSCHSPGRVAPMSFATYEDARPWARQMKAVVTGKKMPPGAVERHYGLLGDDGTLTQVEIDVIALWVDVGAPEGAVQDAAP